MQAAKPKAKTHGAAYGGILVPSLAVSGLARRGFGPFSRGRKPRKPSAAGNERPSSEDGGRFCFCLIVQKRRDVEDAVPYISPELGTDS